MSSSAPGGADRHAPPWGRRCRDDDDGSRPRWSRAGWACGGAADDAAGLGRPGSLPRPPGQARDDAAILSPLAAAASSNDCRQLAECLWEYGFKMCWPFSSVWQRDQGKPGETCDLLDDQRSLTIFYSCRATKSKAALAATTVTGAPKVVPGAGCAVGVGWAGGRRTLALQVLLPWSLGLSSTIARVYIQRASSHPRPCRTWPPLVCSFFWTPRPCDQPRPVMGGPPVASRR